MLRTGSPRKILTSPLSILVPTYQALLKIRYFKYLAVEYIKGPNSNSTGGGGTYDWNAEEQGYILGAFFYGYMITQARFHV